jgi:MFS family permease
MKQFLRKIWNGIQWSCLGILMSLAMIATIVAPIWLVVVVAKHDGWPWAFLVALAIIIFIVGYTKFKSFIEK